jgi:AraC-like DNA-binding protein
MKPVKPVGNGAEAPEFFSPQVSAARRFYLNLNPPKRAALSVLSGGCEHCTPDYEIHRPTFPFYSIEYVIRGRGSLRLQNRCHVLQPGCVFSYGPGVRQDIATEPAEPLVKYFVDFSGLQAKEILRQCRLPAGNLVQVFPPNEIQNIFDELVHSGRRRARQDAELCAKLLECLALKIAGARTPQTEAGGLSFTTYQQCRQHLEAHFHRLKTLREMAEECHLDAAYLCRLFQRYDHQSPYQFLMRLKMNQAAEWLQQSGALVKQVAVRAGFSDQFHFSRAFKGVFGVAPDVFRRLR